MVVQRIISCLLLGAMLAMGLAAQPPAPLSEDYLALIERVRKAKPREEEFTPAFEAAVAHRRQRDGLDGPHARIAVRRDLAAAASTSLAWMDAVGHIKQALSIADALEDARLLRDLHWTQAQNYAGAHDSLSTLQELDAVERLNRSLGDATLVVEIGLLRADAEKRMGGTAQADAAYGQLLELRGVDRLRIAQEWARHTDAAEKGFAERWQHVLDLAQAAGKPALQAEALDQLGYAAGAAKDHARAATMFAAAEALNVPLNRSVRHWRLAIEACVAVGDRPRAHATIQRALAATDEAKSPSSAAEIYEALAELRAQEGDLGQAFKDMQRASQLRRRSDTFRPFVPLARSLVASTSNDRAQAAELAAMRNALRESELERIRLRNRQAVALTIVAAALAAVLGIAYAYKRRAAAALAIERDNAELRAERTHWQMLRYQLSPHFLFNALSSLGGLVITNPRSAGHVIDRLSEFCQMALEGSKEGLRPLSQELKLLRAYLDVEQAGASEGLKVTFDIALETEPLLLPPLLLQPLVENALKYGAQTSPEVLELVIRTQLDAVSGSLCIEISNTGRWLEAGHTPSRRPSVGLTNVRQRLAQCGAPTDALTHVAEAGWVKVRLRLPSVTSPVPASAAA